MSDRIYHPIVVELFNYCGGGTSSEIRARPLAGQRFSPDLYISCSKKMRADHPIGTYLLIKVLLNDKEGGRTFLYSNPRALGTVLTPAQAAEFISKSG